MNTRKKNRSIKFKAWYPRSQSMEQVHGHMWEEDGVNTCELTDCGYEERILLQFTGMKDKDGKEIYEGDILKVRGWGGHVCNVPVEWEEADASDDAGVNMIGFRRFDEYGEPEVVGNMFENPELLNK